MCCGQTARRLDDAAARALFARWKDGTEKRVLVAAFGIGTPEFERIIAEGKFAEWQAAREALLGAGAS